MRMREFGPPAVGEEIGPPLEELGPALGPPIATNEETGLPGTIDGR
jgi:hypothetical protein